MSSHSAAGVTFFLDANILVSAAWKANAEVAGIWNLEGVSLVTSPYVMAEVVRNLPLPIQVERLRKLMTSVAMPAVPGGELDQSIAEIAELPLKDRPVLTGAIQAGADYLITGDKRHFGQWFGKTIGGVRIESPTSLLANFRMRGMGGE